MRKKELSVWQARLLALGFHMLMVGYAVVFLHPYYASNDEFSLAAIASGAYGNYTHYFIYLHSGFALIMKAFYLLFPNINWYTFLMYGMIFISLTAIGWTWIGRARRTGSIGAVLLVMASVYPLYVELQYTKTAAVVTAAGYVLLFCTERGKERKPAVALGIVLLILGSWIRFHSFGMISLLAFGFWLSKVFLAVRGREWKRFLLEDCVPCALAFSLVFGSIWAENCIVYRPGTAEAHYKEYDKARQELLDYGVPEWEEYQAEYEALGLTRTDCLNLQNWLIADYDRYTADIFRSIIAFRKGRPFQWEYLPDYLLILAKKPLFVLGALMTLLWLGLNWKREKKGWIAAGYFYVALLGIYLYFISIYRVLPIVVTACLLGFLIFVWSAAEEGIAGKLEEGLTGKRLWAGFGGAALVTLGVCVNMLVRPVFLPKAQDSEVSIAFRELYDTISKNKELYYVFDPYTNNGMELGYSIFEKLPEGYLSNIFSLGGWENESPQTVANLERYEARSLLTSLYLNDRAVLISDTLLEHIMLHLQDTYDGIFITYSKLNQIGNYSLYALNYRMHNVKDQSDFAVLDKTYTAERERYDVFEGAVDMEPEDLAGKSVFLRVESKESGKVRSYQGVWLQQGEDGLYSMLYDGGLERTQRARFMIPKMSYPLDDRYEVHIVLRDQDSRRQLVTENRLYGTGKD